MAERRNNPRGNRDRDQKKDEQGEELDERVIDIARVVKVIQGGRRFAFRTTILVVDNKSRAVPEAIRKATDRARKQMRPVSLSGRTIPHEVIAQYGGARVMLKPAS